MGEYRQVTVTYHGRVQGVGFRFTAAHLSQRAGVKGYVMNIPDGTVRLVAEGKEEILHRFLGSISASNLGRFITRQDVAWGEPGREFDSFEIRH